MVASDDYVYLAKGVSRLCGWLYILAWSGSFYPQPLKNWRRGSTLGTAIEFPTINTLGFICYTFSTFAFFYSPVIKRQYALRHPYSPESTVRFNDLIFALHGAVLCIITYSQFFPRLWGFRVGARQRTSRIVLGIFWGNVLGILITLFIIWAKSSDGGYDASGWAWIDCVYSLGYVKIICTITKYCPQVYLNYQRKSTQGWSIWQILLDFIGGVLSLLQLVIDSALQADWSGLTGNPVKFGLSNISMIFDIIFITQHYVLYRSSRAKTEDAEIDEQSPLIQTEA